MLGFVTVCEEAWDKFIALGDLSVFVIVIFVIMERTIHEEAFYYPHMARAALDVVKLVFQLQRFELQVVVFLFAVVLFLAQY